jgi:hypothetical protein
MDGQDEQGRGLRRGRAGGQVVCRDEPALALALGQEPVSLAELVDEGQVSLVEAEGQDLRAGWLLDDLRLADDWEQLPESCSSVRSAEGLQRCLVFRGLRRPAKCDSCLPPAATGFVRQSWEHAFAAGPRLPERLDVHSRHPVRR